VGITNPAAKADSPARFQSSAKLDDIQNQNGILVTGGGLVFMAVKGD
jgi:hypothetical protein